jgi:hypoxanthine phosphoribosyltransferase
MQDCHLDREHARARLRRLSTERATIRKLRFGQKLIRLTDFDLVLNAAQLTVQQMAEITLGLVPPVQTQVDRREFGHPSEEVFANILDFYGIAWDYEPRSFPLQWDKDGKVAEAFTPDFYLPEFDIYIELTTMKQAHVTKKNRKVRLLRAIYPHVNIQVFYQKDVQDLVMKYGLPERLAGEPAPTEHHQ